MEQRSLHREVNVRFRGLVVEAVELEAGAVRLPLLPPFHLQPGDLELLAQYLHRDVLSTWRNQLLLCMSKPPAKSEAAWLKAGAAISSFLELLERTEIQIAFMHRLDDNFSRVTQLG